MTAALIWLKLRGLASVALSWAKRATGFLISPYAGPLFATLCVALLLQLFGERAQHKRELRDAVAKAAQKATAKVEKRVEKATATEVERRVEVLKRVQVRSKADMKELDDLHTRLLNMQEVAKHEAEQTPDRDGLPADSVLRIDRFR